MRICCGTVITGTVPYSMCVPGLCRTIRHRMGSITFDVRIYEPGPGYQFVPVTFYGVLTPDDLKTEDRIEFWLAIYLCLPAVPDRGRWRVPASNSHSRL